MYEAWKFWLDVVQIVATAGVGVYLWLVQRTRVNAKRIADFEEHVDRRLDAHSERITRVESALTHLPKGDEFARIHQRLDKFGEDLAGARGELSGTREAVAFIQNFLLNEKKAN